MKNEKDFDHNKQKPPLKSKEDNSNNISKIDVEYIKQKEEANDSNPFLPDSEIIEPEGKIANKVKSKAFGASYLYSQFESAKSELSEGIINTIDNSVNKVLDDIKESLLNSDIRINSENANISSLMNTISKEVKREIDIEKSLREHKVKDLEESKKNIQNKITKLDENIKALDSEVKDSTAISNINDNIKKDHIKNHQNNKEILMQKLEGIDEQVQKLMDTENEREHSKKNNIKQFLDNFEKDKAIAEQRAKKYEEDMKIRQQEMMNSILKGREKKEKEYEAREREEEEKRKKSLEKIRLRELEKIRERNKENLEKMKYFKTHVNDKPAKENQYLFKVLENEYKVKEQNEIQKEIQKQKQKMKEGMVTREEIEEFQRKHKEKELQREIEIEEERKKLREQWKATKDNLPKFESSVMQKVKEEEQKQKEEKEKEEFKKKCKMQEIKNYSEVVSKLFLPKIDENIKKEREERIKSLNARNTIQKHKPKNDFIIKQRQYKPKQIKINIKRVHSTEKNDNNRSRSKSATKPRVPLEKPPDYLTELRIKRKNEERVSNTSSDQVRPSKWEKMMKNNNNTLIDNIEMVKMKAAEIEEKAKMKEKLINVNGEVDVKMQENVSGMLIDAIKAKLTILENISKHN